MKADPLSLCPPSELIIDSLSVERNHVLVRVCAVGGPSERKLPPRALQEVCPFSSLHYTLSFSHT